MTPEEETGVDVGPRKDNVTSQSRTVGHWHPILHHLRGNVFKVTHSLSLDISHMQGDSRLNKVARVYNPTQDGEAGGWPAAGS